MRRIIIFGLTVCAISVISACTLIQNLMIVNSSDEEIDVQYELKDSSNFLPETTSESNFNTWKFLQKDWDKMPTEQYNLDERNKTVKVKIKPHEVVKIGSGDPYYFEKNDYNHFNLKTLKIKGNNKEIYFENSSKLLDEFKKNDFQIIYK